MHELREYSPSQIPLPHVWTQSSHVYIATQSPSPVGSPDAHPSVYSLAQPAGHAFFLYPIHTVPAHDGSAAISAALSLAFATHGRLPPAAAHCDAHVARSWKALSDEFKSSFASTNAVASRRGGANAWRAPSVSASRRGGTSMSRAPSASASRRGGADALRAPSASASRRRPHVHQQVSDPHQVHSAGVSW